MSNKPINPWSIDSEPNRHMSDPWITYYTLRYRGLVRGQIIGRELAQLIADQLNVNEVNGL